MILDSVFGVLNQKYINKVSCSESTEYPHYRNQAPLTAVITLKNYAKKKPVDEILK